MVTVNGQCKADANTARTVRSLIRLTALRLLVLPRRGARTVRGKRARLLLRTHLKANHRRKRLHLQSDHNRPGTKRLLAKADEESPDGRTKSAGLGLCLSVPNMANLGTRTPRARPLTMTLLSSRRIYTTVSDKRCVEEVLMRKFCDFKFTLRDWPSTLRNMHTHGP